jgi:hypothetical protein
LLITGLVLLTVVCGIVCKRRLRNKYDFPVIEALGLKGSKFEEGDRGGMQELSCAQLRISVSEVPRWLREG